MNTDLSTALGYLSFSVSADSGSVSNAQIETKRVNPTLPPGMAIENASTVLLIIEASELIEGFRFSCTWPEHAGVGVACTGQALAAWEWETNDRLIIIGTEEGDYLGERLGLGEISFENNPVKKYPNQIVIEVDEIAKNKTVSIHFVVAENDFPEKHECSCWYAVDIPHQRVLNEFKKS